MAVFKPKNIFRQALYDLNSLVRLSLSKSLFRVFLILFISFYSFDAKGQSVVDTTSRRNYHSPKKAALLSAVVPGLGQVYNKKYWKLPILYAGLGITTYFAIYNNKQFQNYKAEYFAAVRDTSPQDPLKPTPEALLSRVDEFRGYRDLSYGILAAIYLLNIIDATVDAHFFTFDISDNLSMNVQPYSNSLLTFGNQRRVLVNGISVTFTLY